MTVTHLSTVCRVLFFKFVFTYVVLFISHFMKTASRTTAIGTSVIPYCVHCWIYIYFFQLSVCTILCNWPSALHCTCTRMSSLSPLLYHICTHTCILLTANLQLHYDVRLTEAVDNVSNSDSWWKLSKLYWAVRREMGNTPLTGGG
jgi:hypothetical protein